MVRKMAHDHLSSLSQLDAQRVITSLRVGTVPVEHLRTFTVGRQDLLDSVKEDLDFVSGGGSKVRLLAASYGGGKTHLLTLLREEALENGLLVSYVELHSREAPFDRFEIIYSILMQSLRSATSIAGAEEVLDRWTRANRLYNVRDLDAALAKVTSFPDLRNAIKTYVAYSEGSSELHLEYRSAALSWLYGSRLPPGLASKVGVRSPITIANVSEVFRSFLTLARASGFGGVVLLLDEAEAVTTLERSQRRNDANQNLRKLLDNTDSNEGLLVVFATTPRFIEDPDRGAMSYPALWDRIRPVFRQPAVAANTRGTLVHIGALAEEHLVELAVRVFAAYAKAHAWGEGTHLSDAAVAKYVGKFLSSGDPNSVRAFIRGWVTILDSMRGPGDLSAFHSILDGISFDTDGRPT